MNQENVEKPALRVRVFQGLEDLRTPHCVKFASWSILPTCEGGPRGTASGSLLVWN